MATKKKAGVTLATYANQYNEFAAELGEKPVKRFADRKSAERRLAEIAARAKAARKPSKKGVSKPRVGFNFAKGENGIRNMRDGTLRAQVRDALAGGATFDEVCDVVKAFDLDRNKNPENVESRAYGAIRLLHFYVGYGLEERDGKIFLVS